MVDQSETVNFQDCEWNRNDAGFYRTDGGPIRVYYMSWFHRCFYDAPDIEGASEFRTWLEDEHFDGEDWRTAGVVESVIDTRTGEDVTAQVERRYW